MKVASRHGSIWPMHPNEPNLSSVNAHGINDGHMTVPQPAGGSVHWPLSLQMELGKMHVPYRCRAAYCSHCFTTHGVYRNHCPP